MIVIRAFAIEALVSMDEMEERHTASANLANGVIAVGLGCLLFACGPLIGLAFDSDEMRSLVWALIPLPVLSLLSATPIAALRRAQQYKRLAIRSIASFVVGGVLGIVLAISGVGVWALVGQVL